MEKNSITTLGDPDNADIGAVTSATGSDSAAIGDSAATGLAGGFEPAVLIQRLVSTVLDCGDAVLVKDDVGTIRFWNSGAEALYGWSSEEMLGESISTIIPPDRQAEWRHFLDAALRGEHTDAHETLRLHRDGSMVEVSISISPLTDESGRIVGASSVGRGISRQKDLERALRARQGEIDRMVERERMLADASALLAESFDMRDTLNAVGPLCVPVLGDLCVINLVDEMGEINQMRFGFDVETGDQSRRTWRQFSSQAENSIGAAAAIRTGKSQFYSDVDKDLLERVDLDADISAAVRALRVRSAMIVPMSARGEVVGAITLMRASDSRSYEVDDLHFAQRFADRAGVAIDIARQWSERLRVEEQLRASEAQYRLLADSERALLWTAAPDGWITFFSDGWLAFTGMEMAEAVGWGWLPAIHPEDRERVEHLYRQAVERGEGCELEYRLRAADGSYRWVLDRAHPRDLDNNEELDDHHDSSGFVGNCIDITDRKLGEAELAWRATHDALTGLANRSYAFHRAAEQIKALARHPGTVALLFIDVDNLKAVNDVHGHAAGDALLRSVADRLSAVVRKDELLARIGGDEFLVVTEPAEDAGVAVDIAERLLSACADLPPVEGSTPVGVSIGVATTTDPEWHLNELMDEADSAMYSAKSAGGQRFRVADRA